MESDTVGVERRRLPFTLIENVVLEDQALGGVDVLVYLALAKHADGDGVCWPSMATIGKLARCARQTVAEAIKRLEARGYLKRTARFRPDGGVTSNVYQLLELRADPRPPVVQDDSPRRPARQAPVGQGDTNYIQSGPDPRKEREARTPRRATLPSEPSAPLSSQIIAKMKAEAQARGAPPSFIGGSWSAGIRELMVQGASEVELLAAFTACIETAPERVTFFPRDFLKWRKVSRERAAKGQQRPREVRDHGTRERELAQERARILAEQESEEGRATVERALASLPWRRESAGAATCVA